MQETTPEYQGTPIVGDQLQSYLEELCREKRLTREDLRIALISLIPTIPLGGSDDMKELETLSAPLVDWIRKNYSYHTEVHISADFVGVKHAGIGLPFPITEV